MLRSYRLGFSLLLSLLFIFPPILLRSADLDQDGIDDDLEETLAKRFMPWIWYWSHESCPEPGVVLYHVRPFAPGGSADTLAITYLVPYYEDCGINGHEFDLEPFAITLFPLTGSPSGYGVYSMTTWAHPGTICEKVLTTHYDPPVPDLGNPADTIYAAWDTVWVSDDKHAFFLWETECDPACFFTDDCRPELVMNTGRLVPPLDGQFFYLYNIGEINDPLIENFTEINEMGGFSFDPRPVWGLTWMDARYYWSSDGPPLPVEISINSTYDNPLAICEDQSVVFDLTYPSVVRSVIYDIAGVHVNSQYLGEFCPGNDLMIQSWNGRDTNGDCLPYGNYYIVLEALRGNDVASDMDLFGIVFPGGNKPTAPSNLDATVDAEGITLRWTDNATNEDGFVVERRIGSCGFSRLSLVGAHTGIGEVTFTDTDLDTSIGIGYRVFAYRSFIGYSDYSNEVFVTLPTCTSDPYLITSGPTLNADTIYSGQVYTVSVVATDPDCPLIQYEWTVNGDNYTDPGTISGTGDTVYYIAPNLDCGRNFAPSFTNKIDIVTTYRGYSDSASTDWFFIDCAPPPDTSGCPFLYVWNGESFSVENNLLPLSEVDERDRVDYYRLTTRPVLLNKQHILEIREDADEHSHIDAVLLLRADHLPSVEIGTTPEGKIFEYKAVHPPSSVVDATGNNRLGDLMISDGKVFWGRVGDDLHVSFDQTGPGIVVMGIEPGPVLKSFGPLVIPNSREDFPGKGRTGYGTGLPRHIGGNQFIDLHSREDNGGSLSITLSWNGPKGVDFIGTINEWKEVKTDTLIMDTAVHSSRGDVKNKLLYIDGDHVELKPGERIRLLFSGREEPEGVVSDFIMSVYGHYQKGEGPSERIGQRESNE